MKKTRNVGGTPPPRLARKIGTGRFAALMDALRALDAKD
jgi:hypothetical protein